MCVCLSEGGVVRNPHTHFLTVPFSKTLSIHLLEIVNADNARENTFMNKFISTTNQHLGIYIHFLCTQQQGTSCFNGAKLRSEPSPVNEARPSQLIFLVSVKS